jgi:hypothetical protein
MGGPLCLLPHSLPFCAQRPTYRSAMRRRRHIQNYFKEIRQECVHRIKVTQGKGEGRIGQ